MKCVRSLRLSATWTHSLEVCDRTDSLSPGKRSPPPTQFRRPFSDKHPVSLISWSPFPQKTSPMCSSRALRFLTVSQIIRLYETHVTRGLPTQLPLLESAAASPTNHHHYGQNDVFELAAILAERIILNHSYQDGNKRISLIAADMFLKVNGCRLLDNPPRQESAKGSLKDAQVAVASGTWSAGELAEYYRGAASPLEESQKEEMDEC
ncbi:hypothetical protein VTK73DRAFT_8638 [Phialemonium thermophilum]|uniref:Fido domain-containing protein n=1 Tax=Phialemonium thermophilum TaxID=223376 RepID=A0ABR3W7A5_9PEZI